MLMNKMKSKSAMVASGDVAFEEKRSSICMQREYMRKEKLWMSERYDDVVEVVRKMSRYEDIDEV
jgi:hypothetical protein